MDKKRPTYDLRAIKAAFVSAEDLTQRITLSAFHGARALRLSHEDIVKVIRNLSMRDFYKSMTTYGDHRVWQDVYHARHDGMIIYLKFGVDEKDRLILVSFKEK